MAKEIEKRVARLEADREPRRTFVEERHPDGSRQRLSGEGEPRPSDLVVTVIRRFEKAPRNPPSLIKKPKEA
jgi:hypothetical protein